jgi:hypothetical protein
MLYGSSVQQNVGCVHLGTTFRLRLEVLAVERQLCLTASYQTLRPDWWMFSRVDSEGSELARVRLDSPATLYPRVVA